jgi:hypothetical protein
MSLGIVRIPSLLRILATILAAPVHVGFFAQYGRKNVQRFDSMGLDVESQITASIVNMVRLCIFFLISCFGCMFLGQVV